MRSFPLVFDPEHDWAALARPGAEFAIRMGADDAGDISVRLLDEGIDPITPVTIVENGTLPNERSLKTTIGSLWETVQLRGVTGPAMVYSGLGRAPANVVAFPVREDIRDAVLKVAS